MVGTTVPQARVIGWVGGWESKRAVRYNYAYVECSGARACKRLRLNQVNPYCELPIYSAETCSIYQLHEPADLAPHVFAMAQAAHKSMLTDGMRCASPPPPPHAPTC